MTEKRTVVCLCGSTRFYEEFQAANYRETMAGRIVLSVGFYPHSVEKAHHKTVGCTSDQKIELDKLHFDKIEMADEVYILNRDGYVGESTRNEIIHARSLGKRLRWLETDKIPGEFLFPPKLSDSLRLILAEIVDERARQDLKWGGPLHDNAHSQEEWIELIHEYLGGESHRARSCEYRQMMMISASLAVAAIESHDRLAKLNSYADESTRCMVDEANS